MYTLGLKKNRYSQFCTIMSEYLKPVVKTTSFLVDTGACYTSCTSESIDVNLRESDFAGKLKPVMFGGYGTIAGTVHYEYKVNNFLVGNIDLGEQVVYVTFDKKIDTNLLGIDLLQKLTLFQLKDSERLLIADNVVGVVDFELSNLESSDSDYLDLVYRCLSSIKRKVTDKREIERMSKYLLS